MRNVRIARTKLPMVHAAGQSPGACGVPGMLIDISMYPVVKQSLFHDCSIPLRQLKFAMGISSMVITSLPSLVVIA